MRGSIHARVTPGSCTFKKKSRSVVALGSDECAARMGAFWSTEALPACSSDRERDSWLRYDVQEGSDGDVLDVMDKGQRAFAVLVQSSQARIASPLPYSCARIQVVHRLLVQVVRDLEPAAYEFRTTATTAPPPRVMLHTLVSRGGARSEIVTPTRRVLCEVINKSSAYDELLWSEPRP
jgi:hypothetical protein